MNRGSFGGSATTCSIMGCTGSPYERGLFDVSKSKFQAYFQNEAYIYHWS